MINILKLKNFENVYTVPCLEKEFRKATSERWTVKPPYPRYQKKLFGLLEVLNTKGREVQKDPEHFEDVGDGFYSIRYPHSKANPRVLFVFKGNKAILLYAFKEESGGRGYAAAKEVAKGRLREIIDALN